MGDSFKKRYEKAAKAVGVINKSIVPLAYKHNYAGSPNSVSKYTGSAKASSSSSSGSSPIISVTDAKSTKPPRITTNDYSLNNKAQDNSWASVVNEGWQRHNPASAEELKANKGDVFKAYSYEKLQDLVSKSDAERAKIDRAKEQNDMWAAEIIGSGLYDMPKVEAEPEPAPAPFVGSVDVADTVYKPAKGSSIDVYERAGTWSRAEEQELKEIRSRLSKRNNKAAYNPEDYGRDPNMSLDELMQLYRSLLFKRNNSGYETAVDYFPANPYGRNWLADTVINPIDYGIGMAADNLTNFLAGVGNAVLPAPASGGFSTTNYYASEYEKDRENLYGENNTGAIGGANEVASNVASAVGGMAPQIATALMTGGASAAAQGASPLLVNNGTKLALQMAPRAVAGASAYGGTYAEAKANGADEITAHAAGIATATVEMLTEELASGNPYLDKGFLASGAEEAIEKAIRNLNTNTATKWVLQGAADMFGEGVEEYISGIAGQFIERMYKEDPRSLTETFNEAMVDSLEDFIYGALASAVLGAAYSPNPIANYQAYAEELRNNPPAKNVTPAAEPAVENTPAAEAVAPAEPTVAPAAEPVAEAPTAYPDVTDEQFMQAVNEVGGKAAPITDAELEAAMTPNATDKVAAEEAQLLNALAEVDQEKVLESAAPEWRSQFEKVRGISERLGGAKVVATYDLPNRVAGKVTEGMYDPNTDTIYISVNAKNPAQQVFFHEMTHSLRNSSDWGKFLKYSENFFEKNLYAKYGATSQQLKDSIREEYKKVYPNITEDSLNSLVDEEFAAYCTEEWLFKDEAAIERLVQNSESVARRIWNALKDWLAGSVTGNLTTEEIEMRKAERAFAKAFANRSIDNNIKSDSLRYSLRSMAVDISEGQMRNDLIAAGVFTEEQADKFIANLDTLMQKIMPKADFLDTNESYTRETRPFAAIKPNSDPLYKVSLDFSTICKKRIVTQLIMERLNSQLGRALDGRTQFAITERLRELQSEYDKLQVACAICYVEAARLKSPKVINQFLGNRRAAMVNYFATQNPAVRAEAAAAAAKVKTDAGYDAQTTKKQLPKKVADAATRASRDVRNNYTPSEAEEAIIAKAEQMDASEFLTAGGLTRLAITDPDIYAAFTSKVRSATRSKAVESSVPYYWGDSQGVVTDKMIEDMNRENGMRYQSWSDFQLEHLLDNISAVAELSARGAKMHSYTKVPEFVEVNGNTGMMINLSLIPEGRTGFNDNGELVFSPTEGMSIEDARRLRELYNKTSGTIAIGISDAQIEALLASDDIDYVIPYHTSGLNKGMRRIAKIDGWKDYTNVQNEKAIPGRKQGDKPAFSDWFNEELLAEAERQGLDGVETMRLAAENYKQVCEERGYAPKFENFKDDPNYWKLLIDRRMVDGEGNIIIQQPVQPNFDFDAIGNMVDAAENPATNSLVEEILGIVYKEAEEGNISRVGALKSEEREIAALRNTASEALEDQPGITGRPPMYTMGSIENLLIDTNYMKMVERQNAKGMQWLVDEAATRAGAIKDPNGKPKHFYHGTGAEFTVFDPFAEHKNGQFLGAGFYFTPNRKLAERYSNGRIIDAYILAKSLATPSTHTITKEKILEFMGIMEAKHVWFDEDVANAEALADLISSWDDASILAELSKRFDGNDRNAPYDFTEAALNVFGYDGLLIGDQLVVWDNRLIKSADPITRDNAGSVVPLSERFDTNNIDIRYSMGNIEDLLRNYPSQPAAEENHKGKMSKVASNTFTNTSLFTEAEKNAGNIHMAKEYNYDPVAEKESLRRAVSNLINDYEGEKAAIATEERLSGVDIDEAMMILRYETNIANATGDYSEVRKWAKIIQEMGTKAGQSVQAFAKYTRTPEDTMRKMEGYLQGRADAWAEQNPKKAAAIDNAIDVTSTVDKLKADLKAKGIDISDSAAEQLIDMLKAGESIANVRKAARRAAANGFAELTNAEYAKIVELLNEADKKGIYSKARLDLLNKAYKIVADKMPKHSFKEWFDSWRYFAMLGNTRTHIRNIAGNAANYALTGIKDAAASGAELLVQALGGKINRTKSFTSAFDRNLTAAARNDANDMYALLTNNDKYTARNGIDAMRKFFPDKLMRTNSNILEAEDFFFLKNAYGRALASYLKANGYSEKIFIEAKTDAKKAKALEKARDYAIKEAQKVTFRTPNGLAQKITKMSSDLRSSDKITEKTAGVLLEGVLPFKNTPANILKSGIQYSPIGLAKAFTSDAAALAKGNMSGAEYIDNLTSGLTGTALAVLGYILASTGALTGAPSDDKKEQELKELDGWQAYSAVFPDGTYYSLEWMAPAALPLFVGATANQIMQGDIAFGGEKSINDVTTAILNIAEPLFEMTMLQGLNDTLDTVSYAENKLSSMLTSAATSYATQAVPTALGQVARAVDDTRRTSSSTKSGTAGSIEQTINKVENKIPGLSQGNMPYIDSWGNTEENTGGNFVGRLAFNMFSPGYVSKEENDPVNELLMALYEETGESGVAPKYTSAKVDVKFDDVDTRLTPEQRTEYAAVRGQEAYDMIDALLDDARFNALLDATKAEVIEDVYSLAKAQAAEAVGADRSKTKWYYEAIEAEEKYGVPTEEYILLRRDLDDVSYDKDAYLGKSKALKTAIDEFAAANGYDSVARTALYEMFDISDKAR